MSVALDFSKNNFEKQMNERSSNKKSPKGDSLSTPEEKLVITPGTA